MSRRSIDSEFLRDYDHAFVPDWYERGRKEKDPLYRFFCYYIAFAFLYDEFEINLQKNPKLESKIYFTEFEKISLFIENTLDKYGNNSKSPIKPFKNYNPRSLITEEEWEDGVYCGKTGKKQKYENRIADKKYDPILELFFYIYKVRCNLFHASKNLHNTRDKILIKDSAKVLEDFLERYLRRNKIRII